MVPGGGAAQSGPVTRRKPSRLYTASSMASGVSTVHQIALKALELAPSAQGPMAAVPTLGGPGDPPAPPLVHDHHCMGCGAKSQFQEEGREKAKNGATRISGKCLTCGTKMSKFIAGAQDATV